MWTITKRELKNYFTNPLLWAGLIVMIIVLGQILSPYLSLHYFEPDTEFPELSEEQLGEADVINGYIPSDRARQEADTYRQLGQQFQEAFGYSEEDAAELVADLQERNLSDRELDAYLVEEYSFYNVYDLMRRYAMRRGSAAEVNAYIAHKLQEHPYSHWLSQVFADFGGLFMGGFAVILLAFLYVRDTKRDTYELLHTKPISSRGYIVGKVLGGFCSMLIVLGVLNLIFGTACVIVGKKNGFPVSFWDFPLASLLYIVPNLLMITCIYTMISLLFKSPYPAVPLLFLYQVYSNMGSRGPDGVYGYYGRPLAIMVRFPGQFLEATPPPFVLWNQLFLIGASAGILCLAVWIWERRRIY